MVETSINQLSADINSKQNQQNINSSMFHLNTNTQKISKSRLRRYKSQNHVISLAKNIQIFVASPSKLSKHQRLTKSKSKSKFIQSKLFASAKRVDDKATLLTSSTVSNQSNKMSNFISSGLTKSVSKKSLFNTNTNSNKTTLRNTKSGQFTPSSTQPSDHQMSTIIKQYTNGNKRVSFPFTDDESSIIFDYDLGLNSQILELDQSVENDLTLLRMVK